jgi:hypothetical protein
VRIRSCTRAHMKTPQVSDTAVCARVHVCVCVCVAGDGPVDTTPRMPDIKAQSADKPAGSSTTESAITTAIRVEERKNEREKELKSEA